MIRILCVGTIKESYIKEAISDYMKRINKYHNIIIEEVDNDDKVLKRIKERDYVITLEIDGPVVSSVQLASKINQLLIDGKSQIVFIIGGSNGILDEVKKKRNEAISFSKLTFPHQLFRVILLEQIYRSFKIINNETYHK